MLLQMKIWGTAKRNQSKSKEIPINKFSFKQSTYLASNRFPKTGKVNVFVGSRPNLDLVFAVPAAELARCLTSPEKVLDTKSMNVIILHRSDKKIASWVLRWVLAEGKDMTVNPHEKPPTPEKEIDIHIRRLQVILQLGIPALEKQTKTRVAHLQLNSPVSIHSVAWVYAHTTKTVAPSLRTFLVQGIIKGVFPPPGKGVHISYAIAADFEKKYPVFTRDLARDLTSKKNLARFEAMSRSRAATVPQLRFLYKFSLPDSRIRKVFAEGLIRLIEQGIVDNVGPYHRYAWENDEFEKDMAEAIVKQESWLATKPWGMKVATLPPKDQNSIVVIQGKEKIQPAERGDDQGKVVLAKEKMHSAKASRHRKGKQPAKNIDEKIQKQQDTSNKPGVGQDREGIAKRKRYSRHRGSQTGKLKGNGATPVPN